MTTHKQRGLALRRVHACSSARCRASARAKRLAAAHCGVGGVGGDVKIAPDFCTKFERHRACDRVIQGQITGHRRFYLR